METVFSVCSWLVLNRSGIIFVSVFCKPNNYWKSLCPDFYYLAISEQRYNVWILEWDIRLPRCHLSLWFKQWYISWHQVWTTIVRINGESKLCDWLSLSFFFCLHTHSSAKFGNSPWGSLSLVWIRKFLLYFKNQIEVLRRLKCLKLSKWFSLLSLRVLLNMLLLFRNNEQ